jgi:hypothetical protein
MRCIPTDAVGITLGVDTFKVIFPVGSATARAGCPTDLKP